jgi:glucosamine-6-phosphate deaminase
MLVVIRDTHEEVSKETARIVAKAVRVKPNLTLGLATGGTPLAMYRELIRLHKEEGIDFSNIVTFNLDEYLGLPADHPQSYHYFMDTNFFQHVNINTKNIHIPDGTTQRDYEIYCEHYEDTIRQTGGIDLQILGIGQNGHIGFNEPTSSLASRTRVKTLTKQTVDDNRRFFREDEEVPQCAITMGIGTILEARRILLMASGVTKAKALASAIEGPITASITASALQLHRDVTIICDEGAAAELREKEYYQRVVEMTYKVTPDRLW